MSHMHYYLVLRQKVSRDNLLTLFEAAGQAQVHPELLEKMVDLGLIEPEQTQPQMLFAPQVVGDICRAMRLHYQLGVNWAGVGLVMDLLERISDLESELNRFRHS